MEKLTEDLKIGEFIEYKGKKVKLKGVYLVNGEGRGFIADDEEGTEYKFSVTCGKRINVFN